MDWSTLALELIERILVWTKSPVTVVNVGFLVCKNWRAVSEDQIFWKDLYYATSSHKYKRDYEVDWKTKVMDFVLIRKNIKQSRCIVKAIVTTDTPREPYRSAEIRSFAFYKDYFLCEWSKRGYSTSRTYSHCFDMVTEESVDATCDTFINKYVAKTPSLQYGGPSYSEVSVARIEDALRKRDFSITDSSSITFQMPAGITRRCIENFCIDSDFVGFVESQRPDINPSQVFVVDAETGVVVFQQEFAEEYISDRYFAMYDNYLAMLGGRRCEKLIVVDILTGVTVEKLISSAHKAQIMTRDEIVIRQNNELRIWNYKQNTERVLPNGEMENQPIKMIYNDMWLTFESYQSAMIISFYDMNNGLKVGSVSVRHLSSLGILSQLSDGRLAVSTRTCCHVISFLNSEVARKIKVLLMDIDGSTTEHEIMAYELVNFFLQKVNNKIKSLNSCVIPSQSSSENERHVMIYSQLLTGPVFPDLEEDTRPENSHATKLLSQAIKPIRINTPYQPWLCTNAKIEYICCPDNKVRGAVMIVKEQKIDGRWQLAS